MLNHLFYEKKELAGGFASADEFERFENQFLIKVSDEFKKNYLLYQRLSPKSQNSSFILSDYYSKKHIIIFDSLCDLNSIIDANFSAILESREGRTIHNNQGNILIVGYCAFGDKIGVGINKDIFLDKIFFIPFGDPTDFVADDDFSLIYPTIEIAPNLETFY
jgi:hypothetical protein